MANDNRPSGFKPHGAICRASRYIAGSTCYPGDAVRISADGAVDAVTAGATILGVAAEYATVGESIMVWDDPDQKFIAQDDGVGTAVEQTDIGLNYDIVVGTPSTVYKQSRMEVDLSTAATTATLQLKLVAIDRTEGNAASSANAQVIVAINLRQLHTVLGA